MATRRPHKSLVVLACDGTPDNAARFLAGALAEIGVETIYLGREQSAERIATAAADERADAVELCLSEGEGVVQLLRELLRELIRRGRGDVSIVVHRVEPPTESRGIA